VTDPTTTETWEGDRAARWVRQAAGLERQLAPAGTLLLDAAALAPGEAVLDVGCGTGPTTRTAAVAVGPDGRVTGLDVSQEMLDAAAASPAEPGAAPLDWVLADAVGWSPPAPPPYDVVLSRFGVMFFSDPAAAFANLACATRSGGRLVVAVWARRDESELFSVSLRAALDALERSGISPEVPADDTGPFSLHDPAAVDALLTGAGWADVEVAAHEVLMPFPGDSPEEAALAALDFGPTRTVMTGIEGPAADAAVAAIAEAFAAHLDADGRVLLEGSVRIIRARRP
jgi:SAM-dependent methyltransferase